MLTVSLRSGVVPGVAAATISQPADGLLSKMSKKAAEHVGSTIVQDGNGEAVNPRLFARWLHGRLTAGQFAIVDACMTMVGSSRCHFHVRF